MSEKLSAPRTECEKILNAQIADVNAIIERVVKHKNFYEAYENFVVELEGWREITKDFLLKIFPDQTIAKKFDEKSSGGFLFAAADEFECFQEYQREIKVEIGYLQTCIKKLSFFEEPQLSEHIFAPGQQFSAFQAVSNLIKSANQSIFLVDGYVDDATLAILSATNTGVSRQILTKKWSNKTHFQTAIANFNKQHGSIEVRINEDYHDRYIIIDDKEVHQVGGSLKDLGSKATTLIQLTTPKIIQSLITQVKSDWAISTKI